MRAFKVSRALAALLAIVSTVACDPCAGTPDCRTGDRVSYTGRIVEHATGAPVAGASITFVRTSGISLVGDTLRAVSDHDGFFQLSADAGAPGEVTGTLGVSPPNRPSYSVPNTTLRTTRVGGDGGTLGRILADPFIGFIGEVRTRGSGAVEPFIGVVFRRTGGVEVDSSEIHTQTDQYGRFYLSPQPKSAGVLEGTLTLSPRFQLPLDYKLRLTTVYKDSVVRDVAVFNTNIALLWAGEVYRRGTNEHVAGISVDFQRTGGIEVDPDHFTAKTSADGYFPIQPTPIRYGELVGDITIHPPAPYSAFVVHDVRVSTFLDDSVRLAGRWGYGSQVLGAIQFIDRTTQAPLDTGNVVTFTRTGGVAARSNTSVSATNKFGFAKVQFTTDLVGDLVGDVTVDLGAGGVETIRGVTVPSREADDLPSFGNRTVGRWFPQVGQLVDSVTLKPIPGARVRFVRLDGVAISPDPYEVVPNSDGYFAIRPRPLADGDVSGNLVFLLPPPYPPTVTIQGLHLLSSRDDTLRFVGSWRVAPQK